MKLRHRRLISIITSFIMAVTVFGCTSLTFAADGDEDTVSAVGSDQLETNVEEDTPSNTAPDNDITKDVGGTVPGSDEKSTEKRAGEDESGLSAPSNLNAVAGDKMVTLTWDEVSPTSDDGTITYEIFDSNDESAEPIATVSELTYEITGLEVGTYTYYICAVETRSEGEPIQSDIVPFNEVKIIDFASQKLTGLRSDPGYRAVLLEWNPVEGATGYLVFRRQGIERGNVDNNCIDSDGHRLKTFRSSKSRGYQQKFQTGYSQIIDLTVEKATKNANTGKIEYRDGKLQELNMTHVYFYQYVIVPYYKDSAGNVTYCKGNNGAKTITNTTLKSTIGTDINVNTVKNNTVLPMYVLYRVKKAKPYYKTNSMKDGKKMGTLSKGTYYLGFDKKDGRDRFYMAKGGRTEYWFAQKNANVIQGYYLNNGNAKDIKRKDWQTGYSKKTVLDYVNHSGVPTGNGKLIWVSKYAQHAYIFTGSKGNWKLINNGDNFVTSVKKGAWANLCATGAVMYNSRNHNGPINGKQYRKKTKRYWYYSISKLHPSERLHSVLMKKKAGLYSGKYHDPTLGAPKSNGCLRLKPGAADFIYKWAPKGTRVIVY